MLVALQRGSSALEAPPSPEHSTIMLDDYREIMRGMFWQFDEKVKAGSTLNFRVLFPCVCVVIQEATSDEY